MDQSLAIMLQQLCYSKISFIICSLVAEIVLLVRTVDVVRELCLRILAELIHLE